MKDINRILVVSRSTKHCQKAVHYGISLAQKYGAKLFVIHVLHNPFTLKGWNIGIPSLQMEYERLQQTFREDIDHMVEAEKTKGLAVEAVMKEGNPAEEIIKMVEEENIDLLIMLTHEEGHFEHFLFGRDNEDLIRKMPCSIMLVKKEPDKAA
ncbi:MAG: universal stress protein [Syntrophobacteraceae bacterium]